MKQAILSLVFALLLLGGCKCPQIAASSDTDNVVYRDSISTVIVKDTVLVYPIQENKVVAVDSSYLKTDLAFSFAKILPSGGLFHSIANFGSVPGKVIIKNTATSQNTKKTVTIQKTVTITKVIRGFFWWSGVIGWSVFLLWVGYKLRKLFSLSS